jgi:hypothetical protein
MIRETVKARQKISSEHTQRKADDPSGHILWAATVKRGKEGLEF